jgi:hypothetical protein
MVGVRDEARKVAIRSSVNREDESASVLLLCDIREVLDDDEAIHTSALIEMLVKREDRPWSEWKNGKPITPRGIARLLEPFGIRPKQVKLSGVNNNGYTTDALVSAFSRYLSPTLSTAQHGQRVAGKAERLPEGSGRGLNLTVTATEKTLVDVVGDGNRFVEETHRGPLGKYSAPSLRRLTSPMEVLGKFGGRLQRAPLLIAIRRECTCSQEQAELVLDVHVEAGSISLSNEGWYEVPGEKKRPRRWHERQDEGGLS